MQNAERNRLVRNASGASTAAGVVIKCCIGLGIVTLLALMGAETPGDNAVMPDASQIARAMPAAQDDSSAAAHRKRIFDERRARADGLANQHMAMRPKVDGDPANTLPLALSP